MNTLELLWLLVVIASTIFLHFLISRGIVFYENRYTGENERLPGYIRTIQRTLLMLIWLVATFLCSYVFFQEDMYETITTHLLRSIWIGSVVLVCVILNAICLNFFDRRIVEYSEAEEKDPTTYKFFKYFSSFVIFLFGGILIAFSIPGLRSVAQSALAIMQEEAMNHPYFYDNRTESEMNREEPAVRAKVLNLEKSSVRLRAWVWARNYPAGFNLRLDLYKSIKKRFDREGIEIPFPHLTIVYKNTNEANQ